MGPRSCRSSKKSADSHTGTAEKGDALYNMVAHIAAVKSLSIQRSFNFGETESAFDGTADIFYIVSNLIGSGDFIQNAFPLPGAFTENISVILLQSSGEGRRLAAETFRGIIPVQTCYFISSIQW